MADVQVKDKKRDHSFLNFKGVNTQADRRAIEDDEFAWLENVMPIGNGNARTVPGPSAALAALGGAENCYYMAEGNISNVSYMFMFCTSGSAYQVNLLTPYTVTQIGGNGATPFSGTVSRIAQWKNERILIIDTAYGYFDWDGTTLTTYKGAIESVNVAFGGTTFVNNSSTSITVTGGGGSGLAMTYTIAVNAQVFSTAGSGYIVGDVLTITGGTFTSPCTITVATVDGSGAITAANLTTTGIYTVYAGSSAVVCTGGHGTGAKFTLIWGIYAVTITNAGSGYTSAPTLGLSGGTGTAAQLTANLAINTTGTAIAVYAGRVWIGKNRTIVFSAPDSYKDFNPDDLGGSKVMTDDTMKANIIRMFSANNFLYIISSNSFNVISNVTVTAAVYTGTGSIITPAVTNFSNTNLTPDAGTEMYDSVVSTGRSIVFAVDYGIIRITGATPQKFSDALDGVFTRLDFSQAVSAGTATILNIKCLCLLVKYNDPLTGTARQLLCVHFNNKWFFCSQLSGMKFIATASPDPDVPALWATDGNNLYKLFSDTTNNLAQIIRTKLWNMGSSLVTKEALKVGLEIISPITVANISVDVETENSKQTYNFSGGNTLIWTNNSGVTISWTNNTSAPIVWTALGYLFNQSNAESVGNYLGLTVESDSPGITYIGAHLQYEPRTPWVTVP